MIQGNLVGLTQVEPGGCHRCCKEVNLGRFPFLVITFGLICFWLFCYRLLLVLVDICSTKVILNTGMLILKKQ